MRTSPSPGSLALALCALGLWGLPSGATAQTLTYGTLDNFDVINDTGGDCHGFEIELDDISPADVVYTFGAPYQRYGDPVVVPTATGVSIRYMAAYSAGSWSATTPSTPPPWLPTQGHSCWTGGVADPAEYYASGCDHFGASLNAVPTATRYHWLVEGAIPGTLVQFGTQTRLPAPVWNVTPAAGGAPAEAVAVVVPPPPDAYEFGDALWAKVFVTELPDGLHPDDLDHMVIDDPLDDMVPHEPIEVEIEWVLLQARAGYPPEQSFGDGVGVGDGNDAVSRRFEFYEYAGEYDIENHEALCDNPLAPDQQVEGRCGLPVDGVAGVGVLIGAHNAAVNLLGDLPVANQPPSPVADGVTTPEDLAVSIDVLWNDTDPDGDSLTLVSAQDAVGGDVTLAAGHVLYSVWPDFNGDGGFSYTVDDGHGGTATGYVVVTVTAVNDPPVAGADAAVTAEDVSAVLSPATLLVNDDDVDGDVLMIASVQDPSNGSVALVGGDVVFTPVANFFGVGGFTYTVSDGQGGTAVAPVTVTVTPVNDVPVAVPGPAQSVRRRVTVHLDGTGSWDVESGAALTYHWAFTAQPAHSRAVLSDPSSPTPTFVADKRGDFVVSLVVNDGEVPSAGATVTITARTGK